MECPCGYILGLSWNLRLKCTDGSCDTAANKACYEEHCRLLKASDPIEQDKENGKWYWWDEVWMNRSGPYDTREEASRACSEYAKTL